MKNTFRIINPLILPLGLFILAFLCLGRLETLPEGLIWLVKHSPYLIFAAAAVLSWRFNKSRVFFIVLVLAVTHFFISSPTIVMGNMKFDKAAVTYMASLLIFLDILALTFLKERGIFTVWGLINTVFISLELATVYYLFHSESSKVTSFFNLKLLPWNIKTSSPVPQIIILIFLVISGIIITRFIFSRSYIDAANLIVLAAAFSTVCLGGVKMSGVVFSAASGLILIISVIQESYSMAFLDELTGLPSRRSLKYELMKLSGRYTIAMLDIDFFKKFNDTYGHDVGDQVLKMVAGCILDVTGGGKPFRYGGEEFTVLFPNKGLKDSIPHLEKLRETVSQRGFTQRSANRPKNKPKRSSGKSGAGKQLFVTISIGVAEKNEKYRLPDEVIKGADTALYRAKKKGRNCVSK